MNRGVAAWFQNIISCQSFLGRSLTTQKFLTHLVSLSISFCMYLSLIWFWICLFLFYIFSSIAIIDSTVDDDVVSFGVICLLLLHNPSSTTVIYLVGDDDRVIHLFLLSISSSVAAIDLIVVEDGFYIIVGCFFEWNSEWRRRISLNEVVDDGEWVILST